ncbi:unnamed protein product [Amoebophrya sp. A25]|nr:unnamed protein product [Amoebophrya sp. A25]|eukprot:GSA25T00019379001.1
MKPSVSSSSTSSVLASEQVPVEQWAALLATHYGIDASGQLLSKVRNRNLHLTTSGPGAFAAAGTLSTKAGHFSGTGKAPLQGGFIAPSTTREGGGRKIGRRPRALIGHDKARKLGVYDIGGTTTTTSAKAIEETTSSGTFQVHKTRRPPQRALTTLESKLLGVGMEREEEEQEEVVRHGGQRAASRATKSDDLQSTMLARKLHCSKNSRTATAGATSHVVNGDDAAPVEKNVSSSSTSPPRITGTRSRRKKEKPVAGFAKFQLLAEKWTEYFEKRERVLNKDTVLIGARVRVWDRERVIRRPARGRGVGQDEQKIVEQQVEQQDRPDHMEIDLDEGTASKPLKKTRQKEPRPTSPPAPQDGRILLKSGIIVKETAQMLEVVGSDSRLRKYPKDVVTMELLRYPGPVFFHRSTHFF